MGMLNLCQGQMKKSLPPALVLASFADPSIPVPNVLFPIGKNLAMANSGHAGRGSGIGCAINPWSGHFVRNAAYTKRLVLILPCTLFSLARVVAIATVMDAVNQPGE